MATELDVQSAAERDSNKLIEQQLDERIKDLERAADADVLTYMGPIYRPADDEIKDAIESRRSNLLVVLETEGGHIDVAERMARIFRHHYQRVEFLVPSFAASAGTVLVMAGDAIHMDYASTLGPIDPQIKKGEGAPVPALGYLEQFRRLVEKSDKGTLTTAELAYMVRNFDPAELYRYEQERELSIALLKEWLVSFKFKDWTTTRTRGKTVTRKMRTDRAGTIARQLNKTDRWHSHNRGIPMEVLREDLKLLIDDFGANNNLRQVVHDYYRLLKDYAFMRRGHDLIVLHRRGSYVGF
ncbi:MAG: serine dehydrogenasease [Rubrobacteraceae bacterium]|nr:serine dehydrogenasease [Rubrobacteraceae bacterium]